MGSIKASKLYKVPGRTLRSLADEVDLPTEVEVQEKFIRKSILSQQVGKQLVQ